MVHIIWILMCPHVRGWSRPQGPWLETTGSVQVQVSRWGREQRGGGQWNAKLLSLSHSYRDDAPELSRLLVGHRISDMTSKYNTQSKPFKLETLAVLCKIFHHHGGQPTQKNHKKTIVALLSWAVWAKTAGLQQRSDGLIRGWFDGLMDVSADGSDPWVRHVWGYSYPLLASNTFT